MRNDRMQEGSTAVALAMVTPGYDQDPASGVADYASHQDQAQFEADKRAVYKHPLFPLLALLFEKCEQATQSSDNSTSESFNMDIQAFVQHQERDRKPFLINDPEIDGLMIKAIQVLRIHLLELEKVQELCKDFCNRYITCLKGKMQSENLLRSDYSHHGSGQDGLAPSSGSNGSSPLQVLSSTGNDVESGANGLRVSSTSSRADSVTIDGSMENINGNNHHQGSHGNTGIDELYRPSSARSISSLDNSRQHISSDLEDQRSRSPVHGGTPLSQIGAHPCVPVVTPVNDMYIGQEEDPLSGIPDRVYVEEASYWGLFAKQDTQNELHFVGVAAIHNKQDFDITVAGSPSSMQSDDDEDACSVAAAAGVGNLSARKPKPKRGVLPKQATNIMRAWLFQHLVHPYPTEDEKRTIASQTNLTLLQVNNWFINARRRILQPMLDGANPPDATISNAQSSQQHRTSNSGKQQRLKVRSKHQHSSQQGDWQSEDSGSESNGSSDGEAAYAGLDNSDSRRRIDEDDDLDDDVDSEDGGIDIDESKQFIH